MLKLMPGRLLVAAVVSAVMARSAVVTAAVSTVVVVIVVAVAVAAVAVTIIMLPAVGPHALLPLTEGMVSVVGHAQGRVEDAGGVGESYLARFQAMIAPSTVEAAATAFLKSLSTLGLVEQRRK